MNLKLTSLIIASALVLISCGPSAPAEATPDIAAIRTSVAQTVEAELTQTAAAMPSPTAIEEPATPTTESAEATATQAPLVEVTPTEITCDDAVWVADVTVPDGSEMTPGQDFVKTWKIKNTGSCTWSASYSIIHGYDEKMNGVPDPISTAVAPGEELEISVRFTAPISAGEYRSYWRMANASGQPFGEFFYLSIIVR
jgi:hypothetical protein